MQPIPTLHNYAQYLDWLDAALGPQQAARQAPGPAAGAGRADGPDVQQEEAQAAAARDWLAAEPGEEVSQTPPWPVMVPPMVLVPAGGIWVGAHPADPDAQPDERPRCWVHLPRPFAMSRTPVTFAQWEACRADDGTRHQPGDANWGRGDRPVIHVSWHDAQEYVAWLSRKTGQRFRLPTEAEWLHAFWAGEPQEARYPWGDDLGFRQLRHHAWYGENAQGSTQAVGQHQANAWGLSDMLGNVAEWLDDAYHRSPGEAMNAASAASPQRVYASRVFKGGSWLDRAAQLRPSARDHFNPDHRSYRVGFRVVMDLD